MIFQDRTPRLCSRCLVTVVEAASAYCVPCAGAARYRLTQCVASKLGCCEV